MSQTSISSGHMATHTSLHPQSVHCSVQQRVHQWPQRSVVSVSATGQSDRQCDRRCSAPSHSQVPLGQCHPSVQQAVDAVTCDVFQPPIGWLKLEAYWNIWLMLVTWCVQCVSTMLCVGGVRSHAVLCNTMCACLQCSAMQGLCIA